jgi:hypothetical protein
MLLRAGWIELRADRKPRAFGDNRMLGIPADQMLMYSASGRLMAGCIVSSGKLERNASDLLK